MKILPLLCIVFWWSLPAAEAIEEPFAAVQKDDRIVITRRGKPLSDYVFRDPQILRPYLSNVKSGDGTPLTRLHPPAPDADHATMHPGIWLAFGDVCGHDFWRNKATIRHERFVAGPVSNADGLTFSTVSQLVPPGGGSIAEMKTTLTFTECFGAQCMILWEAEITPAGDGFYFGDQEEMGFGLRMAPRLSEKNGGIITAGDGSTSAKDTWGRTAPWCDYSGPSGEGIMILPSAENFRASWFHNRDYGLMVANPFGKQAFTRREKPDHTPVEKGRTFVLRFGAAIHGDLVLGPAAAGEQLVTQFKGLCGRARLLEKFNGRSVALSRPVVAEGGEWSLSANTFSDCVSLHTVASLYHSACSALEKSGAGLQTWSWTDNAGYPRLVTVAARKDSRGQIVEYVDLRLYDNNDNDAFNLAAGKKPVAPEAGWKLLPDWKIPQGMAGAEAP